VNLVVGGNEAAAAWVTEQLIASNCAASEMIQARRDREGDPEAFHIIAQDGDQIVGGLVGKFWLIWGWLEIDILWVAEAHRGQGLGSRLMAAAENEGRARGCLYAKLNTASFQAPGFYEKLGYRVYGALEGFPPGATSYSMRKELM